ncbi:MAG: TolC family protein [Akkermansiaceae bacterium]|jgi:outer membrane protein TolC
MIKSVVVAALAVVALASCSSTPPSTDPDSPQASAEKRAGLPWWQQLNDPALNQDITTAFASNPGLSSVGLRINRADADVAQARASLLPRLNLGASYREGRREEIDIGPYDLPSWPSSAGLSWEIDVTGKLRAAQNSASEKRNAAIWDFHAARLLLGSRLASARMNLYRFNAEIGNLGEALAANQGTLKSLTERSNAGLIPDATLDKQRAKDEQLRRTKLDLERLRDLTHVQLRTLRGGSNPGKPDRKTFPVPSPLSARPLDQLLTSHPELLAAKARIRSAFQLETSARLDLLPSFQINLLATGAQKKLTDRFRIWTTQAGPSLNIPIYDPARIAALQTRQAEAKIASATYRQTVLDVLAEIDSARINLASHRAQLATAQRETSTLARTRTNAREQFEAGLTSQIEFLDTERQWLAAKRSQTSLHQALLSARIDLIKATGGGRL